MDDNTNAKTIGSIDTTPFYCTDCRQIHHPHTTDMLDCDRKKNWRNVMKKRKEAQKKLSPMRRFAERCLPFLADMREEQEQIEKMPHKSWDDKEL